MGKHERSWVAAAEQAVAAALNGLPASDSIAAIAAAIRASVGTDYVRAEWTGGENYRDPGDVHLVWADRRERIELKFSRASGAGTAKNVSQKTLTQRIDASITSYQQWDQDQGLRSQRYALVESVLGRSLRNQSDYVRELRRLREFNPEILDQIAQITAPGQESYALYAADQLNQYLDRVNLLIHEILGTSDIDTDRQDIIYCVIRNFETDSQTVEFMDFTDMDKRIDRVVASGKSIKFLNGSGRDVLRFSVTWKNICQGGSTPCFNVFVGSANRR